MMTTAIENPMGPVNTRRWPRYHTHLPVLISIRTDVSRVAIPGLAIEISRSGMALYGGVHLQPGDLMEVEFQSSGRLRVAGVVRNRSGYCFGLEFHGLLTSSDATANVLKPGTAPGQDSLPFAYPRDKHNSPWTIWLAKHRGDVSVAISTVLLLLALSGWSSRSAQHDRSQANTPPQPSLTLFEQMLVSLGLAEPPPAPLVMGNPNVQVWVDLHTALYYCPGSEMYGETPGGKLTTQRDAQLDRFEPAARNYCK